MQEKDSLNFRRAESSDVASIISLVSSSFTQSRLDKMIYGCSGISAYIDFQISCDDQYNDAVYYVAVRGEAVVGFIQLTRDVLNSKIYLTYICISTELRSKNIGCKLLHYAINSESRKFSKIVLDVFSENFRALKWYSQLGFNEVSRKHWTVVDPIPCMAEGGVMSGRTQHLVCQQLFGFSQFRIVTKLKSYDVGMLESKYFRVSDSDLFEDDQALAVLQRVEPHCKFLLMGTLSNDVNVLKVEIIPESIHMECGLSTLQNLLDNFVKIESV